MSRTLPRRIPSRQAETILHYLLRDACVEQGRRAVMPSAEVSVMCQNYLALHSVKELIAHIGHAVEVCTGDTIGKEHMPESFLSAVGKSTRQAQNFPLGTRVADMVEELLRQTLHKTGYNLAATGRAMDISEKRLRSYMRAFGITNVKVLKEGTPRKPRIHRFDFLRYKGRMDRASRRRSAAAAKLLPAYLRPKQLDNDQSTPIASGQHGAQTSDASTA